MEHYNRQPATFEESGKSRESYQETTVKHTDENLDINFDKDVANVKFTIKSMRAVTEPFSHKVDGLLEETCEEVDYCL